MVELLFSATISFFYRGVSFEPSLLSIMTDCFPLLIVSYFVFDFYVRAPRGHPTTLPQHRLFPGSSIQQVPDPKCRRRFILIIQRFIDKF